MENIELSIFLRSRWKKLNFRISSCCLVYLRERNNEDKVKVKI